jgi:hypothetical protein
MPDTSKTDPTALITFLNQFLATFTYYCSDYKKNFPSHLHWNKAICKLFCSLLRPSDLPTRLNLQEITDFNTLQLQFRKTVMQLQTSQQLLGKSASGGGVASSVISCINCKLPHTVSDCKKQCTYSTCATSPPHQAKDCPNWKSTKSKSPSSLSSSPPTKAPALPGPPKVNQVAPTLPVVPSSTSSVDPEVIFDSGSAVTTIPTSNFLSRTSSVLIPPLNAITADGSLHSSTDSGIFQGLPSHVLPSFQDILICLSDYLAQGRIAIVDSTSMQIFKKTISADNAIDQFRTRFINDSVITVPVKEKIYTLPVQQFLSSSVNHNDPTVSSTLPSLPFSPAYVVRNYQTANFTNKRQLVRFFH